MSADAEQRISHAKDMIRPTKYRAVEQKIFSHILVSMQHEKTSPDIRPETCFSWGLKIKNNDGTTRYGTCLRGQSAPRPRATLRAAAAAERRRPVGAEIKDQSIESETRTGVQQTGKSNRIRENEIVIAQPVAMIAVCLTS